MILFVLLLALILRLVLLNQSLWLDEAIEVLAVKNNSFVQLFTRYSLGDFHPPLYHLILKFWTSLFGFSEIAARSFSVFTGVATVYIVYLVGREIKDEKLGLISAIIIATAPLGIYYTQEARMYSLAAFLVSLLVYLFLKVLKSTKLIYWIFFTVTLILIFYTDYLPYLILLPLNLFVILQKKKLDSKFLTQWILSQIVAVLFLIPWLPFFAKQLQIGNMAAGNAVWREVVGGFQLKALPLTAVKFVIGRISAYNKIIYGVLVAIPLIFYSVLTIRAFFEKVKEKNLLFSWLILPIIAGFIISIFLPVYSYFRFLFCLPALYLILALGILSFKNIKLQKTLIVAVIAINLISVAIFWNNPRFWRENWKGAVSYIEKNSVNSTAVIFVSLAQTAPYEYYAKSIPFYGPDNWQSKNLQTVWLSRYVQPIFDPNDSLRKLIESSGFVKIEEKDFNGVTFWKYQKTYAYLP